MLRRLGHTAVFASDGQMAIDMATATDAGMLPCSAYTQHSHGLYCDLVTQATLLPLTLQSSTMHADAL
jgi:hypothetical protein